MREMKDSGIEWIGEIPVGWESTRGKNILKLMKRSPEGYDEVITCFRNGEVTLRKNRREDGFTFSDKEIGYQGIHKGDLVIHGMDGFAGAIGVSDSNGKGSPVLVVCTTTQNTSYIMYYLRMLAVQEVFLAMATGIRERSCDLRWNKIACLLFPLPSLEEQHRISTYLDAKCEKIDSIIARQQEVIEKLKAYKLSVITEAVTKGLNPDVKMKDSGVEWIGDVPQHWAIATISRVANMYNGDRSSNYPSGTDIVDEGVIFVTSNNLGSIKLDTDISTNKFITKEKYDSLRGAKLQKNDIIFCLRGSVGKCSINFKFESGTIASSLVCIRPMLINPDYLNFTLHTPMIVEQAKLGAIGIGSQNLAAEDVGKVIIAIPTKNEQQQIADYLDKKCSAIDSAITKKQAIIEKLTAYKKSLIYEVVTGKREV